MTCTKLDVFSFGVLTLHVITNKWPLPDAEFVESPEKKGVYHKVSEADRRKKYIDEMGSEHPHKQLVCLCLNNDSDARPSSQTILSDLESIASKTDLLSTQEHKMPKKGTPILIASLQETLEELKSLHMVKATCLIKDAIDNFIKKSNELKTPLNEIKDDLYTMNELLSESELRWSLNHADELTIYSLPDNAIELHAHAFISRKDAEKLLLQDGLRAGTFLIRQSESRPDNYSLSVRDAGSLVCHYRIFSSKPVRQGKLYFIVPRAMFNSLDTLVQHYKKQPDGLCCQLTDPCPALPTTAAIVPPRETKNDWEIEQSYHQALYNLSKSV